MQIPVKKCFTKAGFKTDEDEGNLEDDDVVEIVEQETYDDDLEPTSEPLPDEQQQIESTVDQDSFIVESSSTEELADDPCEILIPSNKEAFISADKLRSYFLSKNQEKELRLVEQLIDTIDINASQSMTQRTILDYFQQQ